MIKSKPDSHGCRTHLKRVDWPRMETRYQLIRSLADGKFHSGEALARSLGLSRAAIWKQIKGLREQWGMEIHAVSGRGYRLVYPLELLQQDKILMLLPSATRGTLSGLEIHDSIDSTNEYLMLQAAADLPSGQACLAELQTAGRGRRGREWHSPYGSNIYLSLLWRFPLAPIELSGLSLAAGLAVVRALNYLGVTEVGLKWPNDILWQERKLAGLLLEVTGESEGPSQVVLGVGLNTLLSDQQGSGIDQPWVDLTSIPGGKQVGRNQLAAALIHQLVNTLESFERHGLSPLLDEWQQQDLYHNKTVVLRMGNRTIEGKHVGIDKNGALLLLHAGEVKAYYAGEVSLCLNRGDEHANPIG